VAFGFTRSREVAWQFIRELDHCLQGRPEFGVALFRVRTFLEPDFLVARIWRSAL